MQEVLKGKGYVSRVYSDLTEVPANNFDCILLANVLHEILPTEWEGILNKLLESCCDDGYLIILEDKLLPKGESPNKVGFVILDFDSLVALFDAKNAYFINPRDDKYHDRILCTIIQKQGAKKVTNQSIKNALQIRLDNVEKELKKYRQMFSNEKEKTKKGVKKYEETNIGRIYAMYCQLYFNIRCGLEELSSVKS